MKNEVKTAKYISKFTSLSIAIKSAYYKSGDDGRKELIPGQRITFNKGFFETDNEDLINALESRSDFGTAFVRVPKNKTVEEMTAKMKTLEEKDAEIERLKAQNEKLQKQLSEDEAGKDGGESDKTLPPVSEDMSRKDLEEVAVAENISDEDIKKATTKAALINIINENRESLKDNPEFE